MPTAPPAVTELTTALKEAWRAGTPPDAAGAVREHPSLLTDRSVVVELAYEEYCLREEAGTPPDPSRFVGRFPAYRTHIREVLDGHRMLADHPELFGPAAGWPTGGDEVHGLVIQKELGRGAFARVYLARDPEAGDRLVVLKLTPGRSAEGRTLGPIAHPHVVGVLWARAADGMQAVCMPYAGAATLRDAVEVAFADGRPTAAALLSTATAGPPPATPLPAVFDPTVRYTRAVVAVFARLAGAVAHLHRTGVCHGDLKPSNILLAPGGHPYLIDFNLAAAGPTDALRRGGTLPYMAPELLRTMAGGQPERTPPTTADVYAFGAVLFEALAGRVPVEPPTGVEPPAAAVELLVKLPHRPPARTAGLPRPLARLIDACLHPDPAARPTMAEVHRQLAAFESAPRRRRVIVLAAVLMALVGAAGWAAVTSRPAAAVAEPEPDVSTPDGLFARGVQRWAVGDDAGAALDFVKLWQMVGDNRSRAYAGHAQLRVKQPLPAADLLQGAIKNGYAPGWVRSNYALALLSNGGRKQNAAWAADEAEAAVKAAPTDRAARLVLGRARVAVWSADRLMGPADPELVRTVEAAADLPGDDDPIAYRTLAYVRIAFSARQDADLARAVHWLREAVRVGLQPQAIADDMILVKFLGHRPDFRQLLEARPGPARPNAPDPFLSHPPVNHP